MVVIDPVPPESGPPISYGMLEAWRMALTRPNEPTYVGLASDPRAGFNRAAAWTVVAALIATGIGLAGQWFYGNLGTSLAMLENSFPGRDLVVVSSAGLALLLCVVPLAAAGAVVGLLFQAAALQYIAGALGGQGSFGKLAYTIAAYSGPLSIVSGLLSLVPIVNLCLALPLAAYGIALNLLAIKAVNRFSWGRAVATFAILVLIVGICSLVLILLTIRLLPAELLQEFRAG